MLLGEGGVCNALSLLCVPPKAIFVGSPYFSDSLLDSSLFTLTVWIKAFTLVALT